MFFTLSGKIIGSVNVNRLRLTFAVILLSLTHYLVYGTFFPVDASYGRWFWLGLSGLVGFVIGDAMLFEAFIVVGARISMLLMSLVPIMGALIAWFTLGEVLNVVEIMAILMTVTGILWVVADKNRDGDWVKGKKLIWGLFLGLGAALGQTAGLILSKKGLAGDFPALSGNLIRVICAVVAIWGYTALRGKTVSTFRSLKNRKALFSSSAGSFFGPFAGVWLSLVAIKYARIGIASTLMSITPIILIPISYKIFKEKITIHAILGTILAIVGVAILLLSVPT
jgi:drug/metabolite transporter (DMT)-like permease